MITSGSEKLLQLLREPVNVEIPKGWKTAKQLSAETGMSASTILVYLRKAKAKGRKFTIPLSDGTMRPIMHYFIQK